MTGPRYRWTLDAANRRYIVWEGDVVYRTVPINHRHPAHTASYMDRFVALLNGES